MIETEAMKATAPAGYTVCNQTDQPLWILKSQTEVREEKPMRITRALALLAILAAVFTLACSQQKANTPDVTNQIQDSLKSNNLDNVKVSEDKDKGVVTLSGDVKDEQAKAQAEDIAKQNAGGLIIANEIGVRPEGAEGDAKKIDSNLDKGIEDNFKAALELAQFAALFWSGYLSAKGGLPGGFPSVGRAGRSAK